jgi:REP element-mobilizing transposase RayT
MRGENPMELPKRKRTRLEGYDYSRNGIYFLTLCAKEKKPIFSRIVGHGIHDAPRIELTDCGKIVEDAIQFINKNNPDVIIDHHAIMPNHVHLLVRVDGASGKPRPTGAMIPKLVSSLKRYTNKASGMKLWQTGYHDHIVRDEWDYQVRWQYIDGNPAEWAADEYSLP